MELNVTSAHEQRRRFARKKLLATALVRTQKETGGPVLHCGIVTDISMGGVSVVLYEYDPLLLGEGSTFTLDFTPRQSDHAFESSTCRCVWTQQHTYTLTLGAEFTQLSEEDRRAITMLFH